MRHKFFNNSGIRGWGQKNTTVSERRLEGKVK